MANPGVPSNIVQTPFIGGVKVQWDAAPRAGRYMVARRSAGTTPWPNGSWVNGTTLYVGNLYDGSVEMRIRSGVLSNSYTFSDWSPTFTLSSPLASPVYRPEGRQADTIQKVREALETRALRTTVCGYFPRQQYNPISATINIEHCIPASWIWDVTLVLPPCVSTDGISEADSLGLVRTGLAANATAFFGLGIRHTGCLGFDESGFFRVVAKESAISNTFIEVFLPVTFSTR